MSTFSDTGSFLITSGAIQATVPANDIFVLLSLSSLDVPKSEIFTVSLWVTKTLKQKTQKTCWKGQKDRQYLLLYSSLMMIYIYCIEILKLL